MSHENLNYLFVGIRAYGAAMSFAAAVIIWMYGNLVSNPRFSKFVNKIALLKLVLAIQRTISLFYIDFFFTFNNIQMVIVLAVISTWIFFGVLKEYVLLKREKENIQKTFDNPQTMADNALDMLNYKI